VKVKNRVVFNRLEELAPPYLAENWDNSGLQLGAKDRTAEAVLVTLDVDDRAVDRALEVGANLIISHHPLFFKGIKVIDYESPTGRLIRKLIKHDITVYSAHTNLDLAPRGLSQYLAQKLGLNNIKPLGTVKSQQLIKLVVFVPETHLHTVRQAVNDAGAGFIGNYRDCSFRSPGVGTFRPLEGSRPFLGSTGILEEVAEFRLEVIVPAEILSRVVEAMLDAHPYEEVAYDLIPLKNSGQAYSYGRQGELPEAVSLEELAERVKGLLGVEHVAVSGQNPDRVKKICLVPGSGTSMIQTAVREGCQVMITGDVKYHEAKEALESGLAFIDPGHDGMELMAVDMLTSYLEETARNEGWDIKIHGFKEKCLWRKQ